MTLKRDLVPFANLFGVQMVDYRQGIKLVETRSYVSILNVRQATEVNDKIGTAPLAGQFVTGSLHISICQAKAFTGSTQPGARLHVRSGKIPRVAQTPNR